MGSDPIIDPTARDLFDAGLWTIDDGLRFFDVSLGSWTLVPIRPCLESNNGRSVGLGRP